MNSRKRMLESQTAANIQGCSPKNQTLILLDLEKCPQELKGDHSHLVAQEGKGGNR